MTKERLLNFLKEKEFFDKMINNQKNEFKAGWSDEFDFVEDKIAESDRIDYEDELSGFSLTSENTILVSTEHNEDFYFDILEYCEEQNGG